MRTRKWSWFPGWLAVAVAAAAGWSSTAQAQCSAANGCNEAVDHWTFDPLITTGDDMMMIGMWRASTGRWYPTACRFDGSQWIAWAADGHPGFTTNALQNNASLCTLGGHDNVTVMQFGTTLNCTFWGSTFTIHGFDDNNRTLSISGGSGNDTISTYGYNGAANLCGGDGTDEISGCHMTQFLSGGAGNDWLNGFEQTDTLRGGDGHDVLVHTFTGTDLLRGENNDDCVELNSYAFNSASSCDGGSDRHNYPVECTGDSCVEPPTSCGSALSGTVTCCDLSDRTCP